MYTKSRSIPLFILLLLAIVLTFTSKTEASGLDCTDYQYAGESNAEGLVILNNYYVRGYWWDHTDLTIAIQSHPNASQESMDAIRRAISVWRSILNDCLDGVITLQDVTPSDNTPPRNADIVIHFVPSSGGFGFGGLAVCTPQHCPNVMLASIPVPALGYDEVPGWYVEWSALHEIGHALGLGHATNLNESNDIMGYGWIYNPIDPVLSQCDLDALRFIFAWAFEGSDPRPPADGPFVCQ